MSAQARWFHYTLGVKMPLILESKTIRRATADVRGDERAAVWFSCRETWEPTCTPQRGRSVLDMRQATIAETVDRCGKLVRLEVPERCARYTWAHHRRHSRIDPRVADVLEADAKRWGADPAEWRVSYRDVPLGEVVAVEVSDDGLRWELVPFQSAVKEGA